MNKTHYDLIVVGAGPAGMAAALSASKHSVETILLIDRNPFMGGILPQCVHDGFGLTEFCASLTGPEYAEKYDEFIAQSAIECAFDTTVLEAQYKDKYYLTCSSVYCGLVNVSCDALIIATGCRERTIGQMRIPGSRPAGVYTAGSVQYMMNRQNYLPGKSAVILGTGDVGLIMARRLTLEGVKVKMIVGKQAGCLLRNYIQCVKDFEIPFKLGYTVVSTHGNKRLTGVTIAPFNADGSIDYDNKEYIPCDTLVVAAGLIPETEVWSTLNEDLNTYLGIPVDAAMATSQPGVFACGNVVQVYDTADMVSQAGRIAGESAAQWVLSHHLSRAGDFSYSTSGRKLTEEDLALQDSRLVCTMCPLGCVLDVDKQGETLHVRGNSCARGVMFAQDELVDPHRVITSTVRVFQGDCPLVPVRSDCSVSVKYREFFMKFCKKTCLDAVPAVGTVLYEASDEFPANIVTTGAH